MRSARTLAAVGLALLVSAGCTASTSDDDATAPASQSPEPSATTTGSTPEATTTPTARAATTVELLDPDGAQVGTVRLAEVDGGTEVSVEVQGLEPGFHGFHIHATGLCEPDSAAPDDPTTTGAFLSAGGHLGVGESDHGTHPGDLPSLYVTATGDGSLTTVTDAFTPEDLADDDGSAVMIHSGADNFANIPERYAPDGPDEDTRNAGDAGTRVACGVVE